MRLGAETPVDAAATRYMALGRGAITLRGPDPFGGRAPMPLSVDRVVRRERGQIYEIRYRRPHIGDLDGVREAQQ
jgi:hypothetical protein